MGGKNRDRDRKKPAKVKKQVKKKICTFCANKTNDIDYKDIATLKRFVNEKSLASTERFAAVGAEIGLSPVTLATAWSKQHDFVASTIVGVSSEAQLPDIFAAADVTLSAETLAKIDAISKEIMYPMG